MAASKHVALASNAPWTPTFVVGDAQRLQQVVWNLLTNAVKFNPDEGTVTVSLTHTGNAARLEVADNGIGLDLSFMVHVFERFRQADSSPSRAHMGLGLGLSLARYLTELHGGRISAHSDGLGRGSSFVVEIPLTAVPRHATRTAEDLHVPRLDGQRILVVDDDVDGVEMVSAVLREAGAMVVPAFSAAEAFDRACDARTWRSSSRIWRCRMTTNTSSCGVYAGTWDSLCRRLH